MAKMVQKLRGRLLTPLSELLVLSGRDRGDRVVVSMVNVSGAARS